MQKNRAERSIALLYFQSDDVYGDGIPESKNKTKQILIIETVFI